MGLALDVSIASVEMCRASAHGTPSRHAFAAALKAIVCFAFLAYDVASLMNPLPRSNLMTWQF